MINRILDQAFANRWLIVVVFFALSAAGAYFLTTLPLDAVPDITPVQVVINTKTGGLDPEQIEKAISSPIENELGGIAHSKEIRSISKYGLSQVAVTFEDKTDVYWARQQVSERLQNIRGQLPQGLSPELAPITTGLGEVLMYVVEAKPASALAMESEQERLLYLRTIQDLVIRRHLKGAVTGIAEVDSTGGYKKEIHIDVDPDKLEAVGLVINDVIHKLETLGESFGGGYIEEGGQQIIVRTEGAVSDLEQVRNVTIALDIYGKPIQVKDVAQVRRDFSQRLGAATYQGNETVLGTVLMLSGANSRTVAHDAHEALMAVPLPPDVEIKVVYSRQYLVDETMKTVANNLAEGAGLVIIILLLVLGNVRAALLVSLAIPLSMLFAAVGMRYFGISANLMSLGAIDFGLLVDASVVIVENVLRRFSEENRPLSLDERIVVVKSATKEVAKTVTIGLLLIMAVYVPILAMEGVEGKLFRPMVQTVLMALLASLIVALLLMPVLVHFVLGKAKVLGHDTWIFAWIKRLYEPTLRFTLRYRAVVLVPVIVFSALSFWLLTRLGADFMPPLNEGDMVINLARESSIGLYRSLEMQKQSERVISEFDEIDVVFARLGTPESATDPMGVNLADTFLILKPEAKTKDKVDLFERIHAAIDEKVPGQEIMQNQPIEMRFNEILEGSRADVSLKVYGPQLETLIELVEGAQKHIKGIPGASEVEMDALSALRKSPIMNVKIRHDSIAKYDVDISEINHIIESAMAGYHVGSFYEGNWRFPIVVRLSEDFRNDPKQINKLLVGIKDRGAVPLNKLATIERRDHVTTIAHDRGQRYGGVAINIAGRDIESFVHAAKTKLNENLMLPPGYSLSWGGQFKNLERARAKLAIMVPLILLGIFFVMLNHLKSLRQTLIVYMSIPFAVTGGIVALALRGIPFSVSAAIGFIALMGIAILNAMVLVTFFSHLRKSGATVEDAVVHGSIIRLRPVLTTALVASLGFIPMALNTGIGAEVQRPLATVVIGGLLTSTLLTLLVIPMLYLWFERPAKAT